jgi:hypothetical protein
MSAPRRYIRTLGTLPVNFPNLGGRFRDKRVRDQCALKATGHFVGTAFCIATKAAALDAMGFDVAIVWPWTNCS